MSSIAVQGAVGERGSKATTELSSGYNSLAVINGIPIGANSSGLFKLNSGSQDDTTDFTRTFTLATTDFGLSNPKKFRALYLGIKTSARFTVSIKADEQDWRHYPARPPKAGLQRTKVPLGSYSQGRYWTVKISSTSDFTIDSVEIVPIVRSQGIVGY